MGQDFILPTSILASRLSLSTVKSKCFIDKEERTSSRDGVRYGQASVIVALAVGVSFRTKAHAPSYFCGDWKERRSTMC
jgi:hypothetical protein